MTLTPSEYCLLKAVTDLQTDTTLPTRSAVGRRTVANATGANLDLGDRVLLEPWQGFDDEAARLNRDELIKVHHGLPKPVDPSQKSPVVPEPHIEITNKGRETLAEYDADLGTGP